MVINCHSSFVNRFTRLLQLFGSFWVSLRISGAFLLNFVNEILISMAWFICQVICWSALLPRMWRRMTWHDMTTFKLVMNSSAVSLRFDEFNKENLRNVAWQGREDLSVWNVKEKNSLDIRNLCNFTKSSFFKNLTTKLERIKFQNTVSFTNFQ